MGSLAQNTSPSRSSPTLMFCDMVIPAKIAGSSLRRLSMGHRVSEYRIISSAITSPSRRRRG